jgi:hypothetical protein
MKRRKVTMDGRAFAFWRINCSERKGLVIFGIIVVTLSCSSIGVAFSSFCSGALVGETMTEAVAKGVGDSFLHKCHEDTPYLLKCSTHV